MAFTRRSDSYALFRILVVPATCLCAIFRTPVFQWIAVGALGLWLAITLVRAIRDRFKRRGPKKAKLTKPATPTDPAKPEDSDTILPIREMAEEPSPENDLFLIRQVNCRITEQLKTTYPAVSWIWIKRPTAAELCKGGAWRIRVANAEPFNFGEVAISKAAKLKITMLQASPLGETPAQDASDDLEANEELDRVDVKAWYTSVGEDALAEVIDNLNSQGHRKVLVHDNGDVIITTAGTESCVDKIAGFPPRIVWDEFCQLLKEDDYDVSVQPDGLALSW